MAKQRGLGKGLASLIPAASETEAATLKTQDAPAAPAPQKKAKTVRPPVEESAPSAVLTAKIDDVTPNPYQPRKSIDEEQLRALSQSIAEHGVIQPILIRETKEGKQIVAGERRWRAAKMAGIEEIPVRLLDITDAQAMELALVENLQREDLSPIEVAAGIHELIVKLSMTHDQVAQKIGMSRVAVTNKLRLLQLPQEVLDMLEDQSISEGHARALAGLPTAEAAIDYANMAKQRNLSVRQVEELVRNYEEAQRISAALPPRALPPSEFQGEIDRIHQKLHLTVKVAGSRKNMGVLIKGLKKWQVQLLLEYIENNSEELFPHGAEE